MTHGVIVNLQEQLVIARNISIKGGRPLRSALNPKEVHNLPHRDSTMPDQTPGQYKRTLRAMKMHLLQSEVPRANAAIDRLERQIKT